VADGERAEATREVHDPEPIPLALEIGSSRQWRRQKARRHRRARNPTGQRRRSRLHPPSVGGQVDSNIKRNAVSCVCCRSSAPGSGMTFSCDMLIAVSVFTSPVSPAPKVALRLFQACFRLVSTGSVPAGRRHTEFRILGPLEVGDRGGEVSHHWNSSISFIRWRVLG
jgi:hypothetical protein